MRKILTIFIIMSELIHASYNPFFNDTKIPKQEPQVKVIIEKQKAKPRPKMTHPDVSYRGFVHSNKGKYALIGINNEFIITKEDDKVYIAEDIFKVSKITTNFILLKDQYDRAQKIYFTSETQGIR